MRNVSKVLAVLAWLWAGGAVMAQSADDLFAQALVAERTKGAVEAIALYQQVVDRSSGERELAARALSAIGRLQEKRGQVAEARRAYERIRREFGGHVEIVSNANARLAALAVPARPADSRVPRFVMSAGADRFVLSRASLSADGRSMAMMDPDSGDVAVRDMFANDMVRLKVKAGSQRGPQTPAHAEFLALSPDKRHVAFTWVDDAGSNYQLRVMANEVGATPRTLVDSAEFDFWTLAWFPDGKSVLAMAEKPDSTWQLLRVGMSDGRIDIIRSLGWRIRPFTGAVRPSVSPDGRYVAYAALATNPPRPEITFRYPRADGPDPAVAHIYVVPADGSGSEVELVTTASANDAPVWTPDGRHILFISDISGTFDLWSVAIEGGRRVSREQLVLRNVGDVRPIGISGGSYYYQQSRAERPRQISVVALDADRSRGGEPFSASDTFVAGDMAGMAWSPDGEKLAFYRSSAAGGSVAKTWDLVVRTIEDGRERVYKNGAANNLLSSHILWLDGRSLLTLPITHAGANRAQEDAWFHADLATTALRKVATRPRYEALSRTTRTLYVVPGDPFVPREPAPRGSASATRVVAIDIDTLDEREVVNLANRAQSVAGIDVSPDGSALAITTIAPRDANEFQGGLSIVRIDGSGYRELPVTFPVRPEPGARGEVMVAGTCFGWSPDSRSMLCRARTVEGGVGGGVIAIDIDTLQKEELVRLPATQGAGRIVPNPDGTAFALVRGAAGTDERELSIVAADGSGHRSLPVPFERWSPGLLAWTADGQAILVSEDGEKPRLAAISISTGESVVTEVAVEGNLASFDSDGTRAAFIAAGSEVHELFAIDNVALLLK